MPIAMCNKFMKPRKDSFHKLPIKVMNLTFSEWCDCTEKRLKGKNAGNPGKTRGD